MIYPLLTMVAFTFILMLAGFIMRYRAVSSGKVSIGYFRLLNGEAPQYLQQATRHYTNLFEMPVLFYLAAVICVLYPLESGLITALGWLYVVSRLCHAAVHMTYNNVIHRMMVFHISNAVLAALWVVIGLALTA